ncbi:MAG: AAA family ATPase [Methanosarcinaceae archaeon]|nr:AAA family ATPase [Methanosarcinaceae archaeon]
MKENEKGTDLWTLKYRPKTVEDILGNDSAKKSLRILIDGDSVPHIIFYGPPGSGKTTAVLAMAKELFGDSFESNLVYINASDFFDQGKQYIVRDKRFSRILGTDDPSKIQKSVINIFKTIINEYSAIAPIDSDYKIIYIDSAESLTLEAQHALRRIMEKYSSTCRFFFSSAYFSALIPPLRSRCVSLFFNYVLSDELPVFLNYVLAREGFSIEKTDLETIIDKTGGNVSHSLQILQLSGESAKHQMANLYENSETPVVITSEHYLPEMLNTDPHISDLMSAVSSNQNFLNARAALDTLLSDMGLIGSEIIEKISQ